MEQCDPDSPFEKPLETQETPGANQGVSHENKETERPDSEMPDGGRAKHSKLPKHAEVLRYRETILNLGRAIAMQMERERLSPIVPLFTPFQLERIDKFDQLMRYAIEVGQLWAIRDNQRAWTKVWRETKEEATAWFRDQLENAHEPSPKLVGHWDTAAIARAMENRKPVPVWSSLLGKWVIWVKSEAEKETLEKVGLRAPVFTLEELRIMTQAKWDAEHLKRVTAIKRELGGTVQHSSNVGKREWEGKPGMRGGIE